MALIGHSFLKINNLSNKSKNLKREIWQSAIFLFFLKNEHFLNIRNVPAHCRGFPQIHA